jgi:hypothetical protein
MDYLSLKHFHMGCAALSGSLFLLLFAYIVTVAITKRTLL